MKQRLFVDMDGTLAEFKTVDTLENLYEQGYFFNLKPHENVVEAVRQLIEDHSDEVEVFILSAHLSDSKYALAEKNEWLDRHLPEIDAEHRIFPPCGDDKRDYVPKGQLKDDVLLDDYSVNLLSWDPPGKGIKLMTNINGTKGTWQGDRVTFDDAPEKIVDEMIAAMAKSQAVKYHVVSYTVDWYGVPTSDVSTDMVTDNLEEAKKQRDYLLRCDQQRLTPFNHTIRTIRAYPEDIENEDCENFDYDVVEEEDDLERDEEHER